MRKNNLNPQRHSAGAHITADKAIADHISKLYEGVTGEDIYKCLKSVRFYNKLLLCENSIKRTFIKGALGLIKGGDSFSDMIIDTTPKEVCKDINESLIELYEGAIDEAVHRIEEYYHAIISNDHLDEFFNRNFL